ncbi:MAG: molybdopterin-binding/glycosyltransferase family 2 protein [Rhodospirillales bacterium]|nr:molybdopterin-binding/glycosyltransferase family 2 protein [Rhodospirillales bacterium]
MIFGETDVSEAEGAILAHGVEAGGVVFKKGRRLGAADVAALAAAGRASVMAARLEPGDVHEDPAAGAVAAAVAGSGLTASLPFTGRCNLHAAARGMLVADAERIDRLNLVDEAVTVATLPPFAVVEPRQMVATIKIIPFSVSSEVLDRVLAVAHGGMPPMRVAAFAPRRTVLIQTHLGGTRPAVLDKTAVAVNGRLAALGCPPVWETRCGHRASDLAACLETLPEGAADIVLISCASAIVDRRDVVPAAIEAAGGTVDHFGMPVDPGNLLLLGHIGRIAVVGLPGCARSPKLNGFDWVLQRLVAGVAVGRSDIMRMGIGGLLKDTGSRTLSRPQAVDLAETPSAARARTPRIAAIVLAAGRSVRMSGANKLLAEVGGEPMVVGVLRQVLEASARPVVVVTGHEQERVATVLARSGVGDDFWIVYNPEYEEGLSTSLHRGLAALPADVDGVAVCLGDMPEVEAGVLHRLIAAFDPHEGRAICVPTWSGKRGNPVIIASRFFAEIRAISGDVGARSLIGEHPEDVAEVAMDDLPHGAGILQDVDTPEDLRALPRRQSARQAVDAGAGQDRPVDGGEQAVAEEPQKP